MAYFDFCLWHCLLILEASIIGVLCRKDRQRKSNLKKAAEAALLHVQCTAFPLDLPDLVQRRKKKYYLVEGKSRTYGCFFFPSVMGPVRSSSQLHNARQLISSS